MKKIIFIFPAFLLFLLAIPAYGETNRETNRNPESERKITLTPTLSPTKIQDQEENENENEVEEEDDTDNERGEGLDKRNENALEHMSEVAEKVQELLKLNPTGGIGDEVREFAQTQNEAQTQIKEQLNKLEERGWVAKLLIGSDLKAVKNIKSQLNLNQVRIKQLEELKTKFTNAADQAKIQEMIQALTAENNSLQERIILEEQTKSLFGWLVKFLARE